MSKEVCVSIVASANRPVLQNGFKNWERFLDSLKQHKSSYEVIFVGDTSPNFDVEKYPEFKYIYATVKPAQCYEIGFRASKGEVLHWTADDASYGNNATGCNNPLDLAYAKYKEIELKHGNDRKTVIAMNPCEDGGYPQAQFHRFFGGWLHTPVMAPFNLINRDYFVNTLGGYDADFVSGQSENDVVMRVYEDGGRVEMCLEAKLYVHHNQVHPRKNGREDNKFRQWYSTDRKVLEDCWIPAGYGNYEKDNKNVEISKKRLRPVKRFVDDNITTVTQGDYKGIWK